MSIADVQQTAGHIDGQVDGVAGADVGCVHVAAMKAGRERGYCFEFRRGADCAVERLIGNSGDVEVLREGDFAGPDGMQHDAWRQWWIERGV